MKFKITDRSGMLTLVNVDIKGMPLADNQMSVLFEKFVEIAKENIP